MMYEQTFPLGTKVRYAQEELKRAFDTWVVGFDADDGQYLILVDVAGSPFRGLALNLSDWNGPGVTLDKTYVGRRIEWVSGEWLDMLEKPRAKIDGCACIRCGNFAPMAQPNASHPEHGSGLACWSCKTTSKWWFNDGGWEIKT